MSDPADDADQQVEHFNDLARARRLPTGPLFTGHCAWCDEKVAEPRRFCDTWCRDCWDADEKRRGNVADA